MTKQHQILIITLSIIFFAATSALSIAVTIPLMPATGFALTLAEDAAKEKALHRAEQILSTGKGGWLKEEIESPDGKLTAIVTNQSASFLSSETVVIDVKSKSGAEKKRVGHFVDVDGLNVTWAANNNLTIEYQKAKTANFESQKIALGKDIFMVKVIQEKIIAQTRKPNGT